jgi:hypothetical protein
MVTFASSPALLAFTHLVNLSQLTLARTPQISGSKEGGELIRIIWGSVPWSA